MKQLMKRSLRRLLQSGPIQERTAGLASSEEVQALLRACYLGLKDLPPEKRPSLSDLGFRKYSQFEEDGLLLYVFAVIGTTNKKVVELCAGNGVECMAANLIINHGWEGYLFDGDHEKVRQGTEFFAQRPQLQLRQPTYDTVWLTAENVNEVVGRHVQGDIDLLSIDIDGMDYWLWKALDIVRPRVCIIEAANYIPSDLSVTVAYDPNADFARKAGAETYYRGASLLAMAQLARTKGMRLVGANRFGFNCIFVRDDLGRDCLPEVSVASCHANSVTEEAQRRLWPGIRHFDWRPV
jgi:hypothetical protein